MRDSHAKHLVLSTRAACFPLAEETGGCAGELKSGKAGIHGKVCWDLSKEMRPRAEFIFFLMKIRLLFIKAVIFVCTKNAQISSDLVS